VGAFVSVCTVTAPAGCSAHASLVVAVAAAVAASTGFAVAEGAEGKCIEPALADEQLVAAVVAVEALDSRNSSVAADGEAVIDGVAAAAAGVAAVAKDNRHQYAG
jgi:hypothetical protein